jgi:anaerobic ribonucleoside-triphosphate reductase activating protein
MGGEPLCEENVFLTYLIIKTIKDEFPQIPVYVWSGYTLEALKRSSNPKVKDILLMSDYLIDGPYIEELRNVTLEMRGSSN